jgi:hypothetical protein
MITLSDGRQITIDLNHVTIRQFRSLFDTGSTDESSDRIIAKCAGLEYDDLLNLPYPDYRRVFAEFLERARNPLADPNLQSGSTSP